MVMKKVKKMLLTFILAVMIGMLLHIAVFPNDVCEYFVPEIIPLHQEEANAQNVAMKSALQ